MRDKLDQANITERVLMPGLSGLSSWLHRHYSAAQGPSRHRRGRGIARLMILPEFYSTT
ncbi:MAG: hypothetical protein WKG07_19155 [Hymenobacter sp.]